MNIPQDRRSTPGHRSRWRTLLSLVLEGQRTDWKHSLVVVVVIAGMFSTPLVLGSIRSRVYDVVKTQIEQENNARQIAIHPAIEGATPMDDGLLRRLANEHPDARVVGNHKLILGVEGPSGADLVTAQTLVADDPRNDWLGIEPRFAGPLGEDDVVLSDGLGRLIYGSQWEDLWGPEGFAGEAVALRINDRLLQPRFRVVARRALPGKGLYLSPETARQLRRYTLGFGAPRLRLPPEENLLAHALPEPLAAECSVLLAKAEKDPTCGPEERVALTHRFDERQWVSLTTAGPWNLLELRDPLRLGLKEIEWTRRETRVRSVMGDCFELVAPILADLCREALVVPGIEAGVDLRFDDRAAVTTRIVAADAQVRSELPGFTELVDRHGRASDSGDAVLLTSPERLGMVPGDSVDLVVGEHVVPGRIEALYRCSGVPSRGEAGCPLFAEVVATQRLLDVGAGTVQVQSTSPLVFVPTEGGDSHDEILVYAPRVEAVEALADRLQTRHPGMSIRYNVTALARLARQDARLATLFSITAALAAVFLVLALAALTRVDIERRQRQLAQLLILGFERCFVRRLIVAELLLLTVVASLAAAITTEGFCVLTRYLLTRNSEASGGELHGIIAAMGLDGGTFVVVSSLVLACTWSVAQVGAARAARSDPLTLLD